MKKLITQTLAIVIFLTMFGTTASADTKTIQPCGLTAEQLEQGLSDDLKAYAQDFLDAEQEFGVNAVVLASICALESGWGKSNLAKNNNNLFGFKQGKDGYMKFDSVRECIMHCAEKLKDNYLTEDGKYFNGYSLADVNIKYCTEKEWSYVVNDIYDIILSKVQE